MGAITVIKQTVLVKKVITKTQSKFGKASIVVPLNGKDEFLGLNDGVDETAFTEGRSYEVEISISKTGKRYVNRIISAVEGGATTTQTATAPVAAVPTLDRDTRITLMNVGNIAGTLSTGDADAFTKNFDLVKAKYKEEGVL